MNFKLLVVGKSNDKRLEEMVSEYAKKLNHYINYNTVELHVKKKISDTKKLKEIESQLILNHINANSILIVLDEKGSQFTSVKFSAFVQKRLNEGSKEVIFLIGGAFGFSESIYKRANHCMALSKMTFTHQMVRLVFIEQLYRAFTILKGEKYHH